MKKYIRNFIRSYLIVLGVLILAGILNNFMDAIRQILLEVNIPILNSFIGSFIGSISIGNPSISYVISESLKKISKDLAVSFVVSWVTVGFIQIPIEAKYFGKKFAIVRNIVGFLFAAIIGIISLLI